eukprot:2000098-Prymnesium_polylepis.1
MNYCKSGRQLLVFAVLEDARTEPPPPRSPPPPPPYPAGTTMILPLMPDQHTPGATRVVDYGGGDQIIVVHTSAWQLPLATITFGAPDAEVAEAAELAAQACALVVAGGSRRQAVGGGDRRCYAMLC